MVAKHDPRLIIVMMGGNDGQDLLDRDGKVRGRWGRIEWEEHYAALIESFLNALGAGRRTVLWLELPPMHEPRFERKVERIRRIQREVLARVPSAQYVPTDDLLPKSTSNVSRTRSLVEAGECAVHDSDGVHLTAKAGWAFELLVASRILPDMLRTDLPVDDSSLEGVLEDDRRQVPERVSGPFGLRHSRYSRDPQELA